MYLLSRSKKLTCPQSFSMLNPMNEEDFTTQEIKELLNEMILTGEVITEVRDGVTYYKINPEFNITPESASLN